MMVPRPVDGEPGLFTVDGDYPAMAILYHRGDIHDWLTLGLPLERPRSEGS